MSRFKLIRRISFLPKLKGFLPYGNKETKGKPVVLLLEELEALRLCDYLKLTKAEACSRMGVSRPTISRIYASGIQKIAKALVESRKLIIQGGKFEFDSDWIYCNHCSSKFRKDEKQKKECPLCGTKDEMGFSISDVIGGTLVSNNKML